jgi:multidrug efflux pump
LSRRCHKSSVRWIAEPTLWCSVADAALYQYSVLGDTTAEVSEWTPKLLAASATGTTSTAPNNSVRTAAQATLAPTGASVASVGSAVATANEAMIPLSAFARYAPGHTATISFNLAKGKSLSDAETAIHRAEDKIHMGMSAAAGGSWRSGA